METRYVASVFDKGIRYFNRIQPILVVALVLGATTALAASTDSASQVAQERLFAEPLVWVGTQPPPDSESFELLGAIGIFKSGGVQAGFKSLEFFLTEHPHSAWAPALEVNMAEYYRRSGHYSLALSHWQSAWNTTKESKDAAGQKIAVRAFAGWTRLLASLGHKEELEALYKELDALHLRLGGYSTTIEETKEGMETMIGKPGISYRCGSYALGHLAMALGMKQPTILKLFGADSPDGGFTMSELLALAKTNGLAVEAVKRPAGAQLMVPCVVHWKLNHYAAIVGKEGNRYLVEDPTFERAVLMDAATIEAEASGNFILPKGKVPDSWEKLNTQECAKIYGKGIPAYFNDAEDSPDCPCPPCGDDEDTSCDPPASNDGADGGGNNPPNPKCPDCGMPQWSVHEPYITLWLTDIPLLYHRSDSSWVKLILTYKHRGDPQNTQFSGFGDKWSCNWLGMLQQLINSDKLTDVKAGGGVEDFLTNGTPSYDSWRWMGNETAPGGGDPPAIFTPTGSQNFYGFIVGYGDGSTNYLLTERLDRYGRVLEQFNYQTNGNVVQLLSVVDMDGRTNTITYGYGTHPNLITAVTDPYNRTVNFNYDFTQNTDGLLTNIVDAQNMSSYFQYDGNENITNMVTPYGTNAFQYLDAADPIDSLPDRAVLVTEANGDHQLYMHTASSPDPYAVNDPEAESYHWNRRQYELLSDKTNFFTMPAGDYELASAKAWMYENLFETNGGPSGFLTDTLWGQADPVDQTAEVPYRPNNIEYSYVGSGEGPDGSETVGSLKAVTYISTAGGAIGITRNSLGRPTSYIYYDQGQNVLAVYTNTFDSGGMNLQYELGPNNELTRGYGYDPLITNLLTSVTNAVGDVISYAHQSGTLKVTSISFPGGLLRTNIYYANGPSAGFLFAQIDLGIRTNYFAYTNGNLSIQTNELGLVTTYIYDKLNRLTSIAYPDLTTTSNVYNNLDIVATKDRLNQWTRYQYDNVRQLIAVTNVNNQVTTYDYCSCGSPDVITRLDGSSSYSTQLSYDIIGRLTNALYPDGYQLSYGYDNMDRVTNVTDGDSHQLALSWYMYGLQSILQSAALGGQYLLSQLSIDSYGHILQSEDRNEVITTNGYDFLGRLVARQVGPIYAPSGLETFGYSARGLTNYIDALGHTTTLVRDTAGRVVAETNANNEVLQFTYNASDELLSLTNGMNHTTTWKYDSYGRVTNKLDDNNTNLFFYQYDANNRLTNRWTPAKGTTVFRYNPIGNLTNVDYSGGTITTHSIYFDYDGLNRLTNMLDGLGTTTFTWTPGDQLAGENGPWPNDAVNYTFDSGSRQRVGMTIAAPNASPWSQSYSHDSMMRLENVTSPAGSFAYSYLAYTYDRVSQLLLPNVESPSYGAIDNSYNDYLRRLKSTTLGTQLWGSERDYSYDAGSEVTQQVVSVETWFGTAYHFNGYSYDNIGQLKTSQGFDGYPGNLPNPARLQEQFGYAYDKAWNLNYRTNYELVQSFGVDNLNELSSASRTGTLTVAGTATEPSGNAPLDANPGVTSVTVNTTNATVYADGTFAATNMPAVDGWNTYAAIAEDNLSPQPRLDTNTVSVYLPASPSYAYDANGNLLSDGTRSFAYDDENQLVSVWQTNVWRQDFLYDGLLRKRVEKDYNWTGSAWQETSETRFVYDGYLVVQERDRNNLPQVTYTRGNDLSGSLQGVGGIGGLLARTSNSQLLTADPNASAFYFSDGQGNVVAMVNYYGALVAQYEYDPFGNMIAMSGPLAGVNRYRFSSKEWNDAAGLYYYGFRFYDPNLQRWLNRDPIKEDGGVNLYGFVFNAAVNLVDPFGFGCNSDGSQNSQNGLQYMMSPSSPNLLSPPSINPNDPSGTQLQNFAKTAAEGIYNNTDLKNIVNQDVQNVLNSIPGLGWLGNLLGGSGSGLSNPLSISGNTGATSESGIQWNASVDPFRQTLSVNASCHAPFGIPGTINFSGDVQPKKSFDFSDPPIRQAKIFYKLTF